MIINCEVDQTLTLTAEEENYYIFNVMQKLSERWLRWFNVYTKNDGGRTLEFLYILSMTVLPNAKRRQRICSTNDNDISFRSDIGTLDEPEELLEVREAYWNLG